MGIKIYPDLSADERIEFDSMINLRPRLGNKLVELMIQKYKTRLNQL